MGVKSNKLFSTKVNLGNARRIAWAVNYRFWSHLACSGQSAKVSFWRNNKKTLSCPFWNGIEIFRRASPSSSHESHPSLPGDYSRCMRVLSSVDVYGLLYSVFTWTHNLSETHYAWVDISIDLIYLGRRIIRWIRHAYSSCVNKKRKTVVRTAAGRLTTNLVAWIHSSVKSVCLMRVVFTSKQVESKSQSQSLYERGQYA